MFARFVYKYYNVYTVKRKRGRPRKYAIPNDDDGKKICSGLQTPSPKKRKTCKRSADRKNLQFVQYFKGNGTGPEMQIQDLSPQLIYIKYLCLLIIVENVHYPQSDCHINLM